MPLSRSMKMVYDQMAKQRQGQTQAPSGRAGMLSKMFGRARQAQAQKPTPAFGGNRRGARSQPAFGSKVAPGANYGRRYAQARQASDAKRAKPTPYTRGQRFGGRAGGRSAFGGRSRFMR